MNLATLFVQHALASHDKQLYLQAMHGKHRWQLRLDEAALEFSGPHNMKESYRVQFIGTLSQTQKTWRWAWANSETFLNADSLASVREVQAFGDPQDIAELITPELALPDPSDTFAAISSGLCRAGAYFRAAYPDGALFMLIRDARFKRAVQRPLARIARVTQLFSAPPSDDSGKMWNFQTAFEHYLRFYKFEPHPQPLADGSRYVLQPRAGHDAMQIEAQSLLAEFDAQRQLRKIELV